MSVIEFVLAKPESLEDELSLFYTPRDTPIGRKYFNALVDGQRLTILNQNRLHNFPGSAFDRHSISEQINQCVDAINSYVPGLIQLRAEPEMSQERLNRLHYYFEILRGTVLSPPEFWTRAPMYVQAALKQFNLLIHRFEDYERSQQRLRDGLPPKAHLVLGFEERPRHPLADEDYLHCTKQLTFGAWYLAYCETGKPLWDVFQDKDDIIKEADIRPLHYYSAEGHLEFGASMSDEEYAKLMAPFWVWWEQNETKLRRLGFEKGDPKNAIGMIPVADLDRRKGAVAGKSEDEIRAVIGGYQYMSRVVCHGAATASAAAQVFQERIPKRLAKRPELAVRVNARYQFCVTGETGGNWVGDLTRGQNAYVGPGNAIDPDIKVTMTEQDFLDLARGAISTQMAIVRRKLQFEWPMRLALEVRQILG
jgi:hypothetical protein